MIKIPVIIILILCSYSIIPTYLFKLKNIRPSSINSCKKILFLTFDDGPSHEYTPKLLALLKKYNVKVTFFVVANSALQNKDIIQQIKADGHSIALHSCSHKNALLRGRRFSKNDLKKSICIMKKMQCNIKYYRPPWGHLNLFILYYIKRLGLKMVLWDVMAQDWSKNATPVSIEKKILKRVRNGSIICLHDGRGTNGAPAKTIAALEKVIPQLQCRGYNFLTIGDYHEQ